MPVTPRPEGSLIWTTPLAGGAAHVICPAMPEVEWQSAPQLRTAKQRCQWAAGRIADLKQAADLLNHVAGSGGIRVTVDRADFEGRHPLAPTISWARLDGGYSPVAARMVAGEVVNHLRTALDYLAYNLAWLDAGRPQDQTAFPVVRSKVDWIPECRRRLRGVSDAHRAQISNYQPFAGCTWTGRLVDLSNADKHRVLIAVVPEMTGLLRIATDTTHPDPDDPAKLLVDVPDQAARLILPDESDAVNTLEGLAIEVAHLLFEFQSDFGETDELHMPE